MQRCVVPVAVFVLAAIGYWVVFQGTQPSPDWISTLIVAHPGSAELKAEPASSEVVEPSKSTWREVKEAAAVQPDQTGGYSRTWDSTKSSSDSLSVLVEVVPTSSDAEKVHGQVLAEYADAKTLKRDGATVTSRFGVRGVPGAQGVAFQVAASSSAGASKGTVVVFDVGRAVAAVYVETSTGALKGFDLDAVARREHALLERREPAFSLATPTRSALASALYGVAAVLVASLAYLVPGGVRRSRQRRDARHAAALRHEYRSRGSKVLQRRRQSALPYQSSRHRGHRSGRGRR